MLLFLACFIGLPALVIWLAYFGHHAWHRRRWSRLLPIAPAIVVEAFLLWAGVVQMRSERPIVIAESDAIGTYVSRDAGVVDQIVLEADGGFTRTKTTQGRVESQCGRWSVRESAGARYTSIDFDELHPNCLASEREPTAPLLFCATGVSSSYFIKVNGHLALETSDVQPSYWRQQK